MNRRTYPSSPAGLIRLFVLALALVVLAACAGEQPAPVAVAPTQPAATSEPVQTAPTEQPQPTPTTLIPQATPSIPPTVEPIATTEGLTAPTSGETDATAAPVAATPATLAPITPLQATEIVDDPLRNVRAVTDGTRKYRLAAWSPVAQLAAATPQDGPGLDLVDLETGVVTPVVTDTYVLEPRWTDTGELLVHRVEAAGDTLTLYDPRHGFAATPLVTSTPLRAPDYQDGLLVFTRSGNLVVCQGPCAEEEHTLTGGALVAALAPNASDGLLAWTPEVDNLEDVQTFVLPMRDILASASIPTPRPLSLPGEGLWLPRWSPDASRIALTSVEGRLVVVVADGSSRQDLGPGDSPTWSPDGTRIAYAGASAGLDYTTRNIHVVAADSTGNRLRVTNAGEEEFFVSPSWSPDGRQLLFVELDSGQLFIGDL